MWTRTCKVILIEDIYDADEKRFLILMRSDFRFWGEEISDADEKRLGQSGGPLHWLRASLSIVGASYVYYFPQIQHTGGGTS